MLDILKGSKFMFAMLKTFASLCRDVYQDDLELYLER